MDQQKRIWIYAGLATVAGVGLVVAATRNSSANLAPPVGGSPPSPIPPENGSSTSSPQTSFQPIAAGDRLLLLGDSLAAGLTAPMQQLASDAQVTFRGDGRISTTIAQWQQQQWLATDLSFAPKFVLISLGTNDMKLSDPKTEQTQLDQFVKRLVATGATIIWVMPPTMPFSDNGVRAMIDGEGLVEFRSDQLSIARGPDKIHPTTAGYAGWAGAIWQFLARGGAATRRRTVQRAPVVR